MDRANRGAHTQRQESAREPAARTKNPWALSPPHRAMDVYGTPADSLDTLVAGSLQPPAEFMGLARRALGDLGAVLRERRGLPDAAAPRWRVLKVAKVSSGGRGGRRAILIAVGQVFSFIALTVTKLQGHAKCPENILCSQQVYC